MKVIDMRFNQSIFKNMIGKKLIEYKHDPFQSNDLVYSVIFFNIEGEYYRIKNENELVDYYGNKDDYSLWQIEIINKKDIKSSLKGINLLSIPVKEKIENIILINENQQMFENEKLLYDVYLTRAIIIHTKSGDICFEKDMCAFSEEIKISSGYNLIQNYPKENKSFFESWVDSCQIRCNQEILTF